MPANRMFQACDASAFNATSSDENPFTCHAKKEDKNLDGFQISQWVLLVFK